MAQHDTSIAAKLSGTGGCELPSVLKAFHEDKAVCVQFENGAEIEFVTDRITGTVMENARRPTPSIVAATDDDPVYEVWHEDAESVVELSDRRAKEFNQFETLSDAYETWPVAVVDSVIGRPYTRYEYKGQLYNHQHDPFEPNAEA